MKSLLIIGPQPDPIDGCSYANSILCKNLAKQNIRYKTINTNTKTVSSKQGNSFSFNKALKFITAYFQFYKIFSSKVVYFTPGQTFFGLAKYAPFIMLCIFVNKPYIIHVHGNYLGKQYQELNGLKSRIFRLLISKASAGIALSKSLKLNFDNLLPTEKIYVVENFVSDDLFSKSEPSQKKTDKPRLLYLSNLMREKGILELLDALISLQTQGIDFYAEFAGKIEQDIEPNVSEKLKLLGTNTKYLGIIKGDQKLEALKKANIFILPTYYKMEGQPISLLEGMATGNIIITTKHAGIPDIIGDKNGFFVDKNSSSSITSVIIRIVPKLEQTVSVFSNYNAEYAYRFTEKEFVSKIVSIIKSVKTKK